MGIPMIKCALCGKEVTKRQSLLIEPYGRICRSHPEVEAYKEKLAQEVAAIKAKAEADKEMEQSLRRAANVMNVICMTEMIRVMAYRAGVDVSLAWFALRERVPENIREDVMKELIAKGSLTESEMTEAFMTALILQRNHV